ncbi:MAG: nuclear transport factor 2 family protein [Pseudomonadota bacterium]
MDNFSESEYEAALDRFEGSDSMIDSGVEAFALGYGNLAHENLRQRISELYAPELYFNDTIHTHTTRDGLVDYLGRTGDALNESTVEIKQVIRDGNDVFVRWSMVFRLRAVGREIHSESIGMTHLRFNEEGQVLIHQDFWDSGHALYAQLPVIGFFVRRAHARM